MVIPGSLRREFLGRARDPRKIFPLAADPRCFPVPIPALIRGPIHALILARFAAGCGPGSGVESAPRSCAEWCGESGTVGVRFLPTRRAVEGLRVFSRAAHGEEGGHVTPFRLLHSNLRLLWVNLLKAEQLKKKCALAVNAERAPG